MDGLVAHIVKTGGIGFGVGVAVGLVPRIIQHYKTSESKDEPDLVRDFHANHVKDDFRIFNILQRLRRYEHYDPRLFASIVRDCDLLIEIHTTIHTPPAKDRSTRGLMLSKATRHEQNVKWRLMSFGKKVKTANLKDVEFPNLQNELNSACQDLKYNIQLEVFS